MPLLNAPEASVVVRMYRQGLGDCFLVAFSTDDKDRSYYMLIDCGVTLGTPDAVDKMTWIAKDIEAATGGDIHLLVLTHPHWDHISGFLQAREVFKRMRIHNLWCAWTEDPEDLLANQLRARFEADRKALQVALGKVSNPGGLRRVETLLEFFGDLTPASNNNTDQAWRTIRRLAEQSHARTQYMRSGDVMTTLPVIHNLKLHDKVGETARVHVLGPTRPQAPLKVNHLGHMTTDHQAWHKSSGIGKQLLTSDEMNRDEGNYPFDRRVSLSLELAHQHSFFNRYYGVGNASSARQQFKDEANGSLDDIKASLSQTNNDWRRIDDEWLIAAASQSALKLDSDVNNTSLVLAIELPRSKKILLFAGDAQADSWHLWDDIQWASADGSPITTDDLLKRTVLYKVGHRGSHNGTLRSDVGGKKRKGLELMDSPELVAMLPVDQHTASTLKHWPRMPFGLLVNRLSERTWGRLLRADDDFPKSRPHGLSETAWLSFRQNFQETGLYMQFTVADSQAQHRQRVNLIA